MTLFRRFFWISLGVLTAVWGCSDSNSKGSDVSLATQPDRGDLVVSYDVPSEESFVEIYTVLKDSNFFDDLASELNNTYIFPRDIDIVFKSCGEDNAYYDPDSVEVVMCYDLIQRYADISIEEYQSDYSDEIILAGHFTFLHELGHALVDQYQLPIIVREEDVVDSFATILLLQTGKEDAVIAGIEQFDIDAEEDEETLSELPFWEAHSLSIQRVYNIACLVYGSDPQKYADFVADGFLPEERAESCLEEYDQAEAGWQTLLAEFMK